MADQQRPPPPEEDAAERSVVSDDTSTVASAQQPWHPPPLQQPMAPFHAVAMSPPPPPQQQALAMTQYYEAQMREHAAAYASAAAGAAMAAAQIAFGSSNAGFPPALPCAPPLYGPPPHVPGMGPPGMMMGGPYHGGPPIHPPMLDHNSASEDGQSYYRPEKRHQPSSYDGDGTQRQQKRALWTPSSCDENRNVKKPPSSSKNRKPHNNANRNTTTSTKRGRRRLRSAVDSTGSSGGESRGDGKRAGDSHNKKQQRRDDQLLSLVGKTGVSALHEFCDKRHMPPPNFFVVETNGRNDFCMASKIAQQELGRGRGGTKAFAKQDSARRALQSLIPGVVFDENGVLIQIPLDDGTLSARPVATTTTTTTSLEDLAPNLASRLAIAGHDEDSAKKRHRSTAAAASAAPKRRWDVYPGTSTTSEEEDENAYYASRGASVCSALLHAMWQINEGIPEPPSYTYDLLAPAARLKRKGPSGVSSSSFACTATLLLQTPVPNKDCDSRQGNEDTREASATDSADAEHSKTIEENNDAGGDSCKDELQEEDVLGEEADCREQSEGKVQVETLQAVGTGTTKREARHVASAKLLAMLFPECSGMLEVKAAAEAAREEYAASKALKNSKRFYGSFTKTRYNRRRKEQATLSPKSTISFALPSASDPPLPDFLSEQVRQMLEEKVASQGSNLPAEERSPTCGVAAGIASVAALSLSEEPDSVNAISKSKPASSGCIVKGNANESIARQMSRQKQLEDEVDSALQLINELDESGKSLSAGLTEDHVGRIVLRRAGCDDVEWVKKLLNKTHGGATGKRPSHSSESSAALISPVSLLELLPHSSSDSEVSTVMYSHAHLSSVLWGSLSVILLLCRAIALDDEPPLGCAVLTLGFSMERGRLFRVSEIAHEGHLPEERFIECLETFANNMKCSLEQQVQRPSASRDSGPALEGAKEIRLDSHELRAILKAHVFGSPGTTNTKTAQTPSEDALKRASGEVSLLGRTSSGTPLQSVKEEECEGDEEKQKETIADADVRSKKRQGKPNKRSRVA